jgi:CheY-like chemotaxis protein
MNDMNDVVNWLRRIEHLANEIYLQAASYYAADPKLKNFLEHISEDEAWHYHVMGSAAEYLSLDPIIEAAISVDNETSNKIIQYFSDIKSGLEYKTISRDDFIEKIVTTELSEWNDIFLYVVSTLKELTPEFKYPAAKMQSHINEIKYFLEKVENHPETLQKIIALPSVWVENILIVDDSEMITTLYKALLNRDGNIDVANNGEEALAHMQEKYYKLVISDIDMPIMNGISFYKEAIARFPTLDNKFLFISGEISSERQSFFKKVKVPCLLKPVPINKLREESLKILIHPTQSYIV